VFDNLYYIGGPRTGGWLFTTPDGYILLDAMYGDSPEATLMPNMERLGLDPSQIRYILITHAGPDHVGGAAYFQEKYGTRVLMSQEDWDSLLNPQPGAWILRRAAGDISPASRNWRGPPIMDLVGVDGQTLTLGDTTVTIVHTPRRVNGGGLSYIVPVTDNGTPHMFATYGNTNVVGEIADKMLYRESVAHWVEYTNTMNVDVVMSSHPFVDGSVERMAELRNRQPDEANPFVIGTKDARRYFDILDQCAALAIARAEAGLDMTGTQRLD
jgi:metallo-beta-lactamase class B